MKKTIIVFLTMALCVATSAQTLGDITTTFNNGATALQNDDKTTALDSFKKALADAITLGDEGAEIAGKCRDIIPGIIQSIATDQYNAGNLDGAIESLKASLAAAKEYGVSDVETESARRLGQFLAKKGANLLSAGDLAGAKAALLESVQIDSTSGAAFLRLGQVCMKSGDNDGAEEAFKKAANHGQAANANNLLSGLKLKAASASLKVKDFKTALALALESTQYAEKSAAYKIAGNCAAQLKDYAGAVKYFTKYLELSPNAPDAAQTKANIEAFKKL